MPPTPDPEPPQHSPIRSLIPGRASNPRPSPNHPSPSPTPSPSRNPFEANGDASDYAEQPTPGPGSDDTRTASYSPGEPRKRAKIADKADVARMLGGLFVVLAGLAGFLATRAGRELRPPTESERMEVAEPVAAILCRHVGADFLTEDLTDSIRAAAGLVAYIQTDPMPRAHKRRQAPGEIPEELDQPAGPVAGHVLESI